MVTLFGVTSPQSYWVALLPGGSFSKIQFSWQEDEAVLSIAERIGSFPEMEQDKHLCIIFVSEGRGLGVHQSSCDKEVVYSGQAIKITDRSTALFAWWHLGAKKIRQAGQNQLDDESAGCWNELTSLELPTIDFNIHWFCIELASSRPWRPSMCLRLDYYSDRWAAGSANPHTMNFDFDAIFNIIRCPWHL